MSLVAPLSWLPEVDKEPCYYRFDSAAQQGDILASREKCPSVKRILSMRNRLSLEVRLESIRRSSFPTLPSRWTALFFFDTVETARAVQRNHSGWRQTPLWEFKPVRGKGSNVRRHSYDLLTWLKAAGEHTTNEQLDVYWSGGSLRDAGFSQGTIAEPQEEHWELLATGQFEAVRRFDP